MARQNGGGAAHASYIRAGELRLPRVGGRRGHGRADTAAARTKEMFSELEE